MGDEVTAGDGVPTRIVVGTDGSETAERAVWKATALAKAVGAELVVVSAYRNRVFALGAASNGTLGGMRSIMALRQSLELGCGALVGVG